jgi:O-antigen/teichoic acid export membrane protein
MLMARFNTAFARATTGDPRSRRSALLRFAIGSSAVSKACALALQLVAIPLVYRALGQHQYELFLLITGAVSAIAFAQLGAGPGLTHGLATAAARGSREEEAALINAAFRLVSVAALGAAAVIVILLRVIPPHLVFGAEFAEERVAIVRAGDITVLVFAAQLISGVVDSALAGYQEQVFTSVGSAISNLVSLVLILLVCAYTPSLSSVILVLFGVPTLSRVGNFIGLCRRRPYLLERAISSCRGYYRRLLNVGLAFWAIQVGSIIQQYGGTYLLAHLGSAQATVLFGILFKTLSLLGAVITTITQPLWPAFADAVARGDISWIQRSFARIRRVLTLLSCGACALLAAAGPWAFSTFVHVYTAHSGVLFATLGLFFVANVWTHLYYVTMMGMHGIWKIAVTAFAENLLLLVLGAMLVPRLGGVGMALSYLLASLLLPAWLLPRLMRENLRDLTLKQSPA